MGHQKNAGKALVVRIAAVLQKFICIIAKNPACHIHSFTQLDGITAEVFDLSEGKYPVVIKLVVVDFRPTSLGLADTV